MAFMHNFTVFACLAILFSSLVQGILGGVTCEELSKDECAFAISSWGNDVYKYVQRNGLEAYKCTTSQIEADHKLKDLIENSNCIQVCGLNRHTLGISSDSLLESHFTHKLCSPHCYQNCPNIVDLYFNLAAAEGVFLPKLCKTQSENPRRGMAELKSSGIATPGPVSGIESIGLQYGPAMGPIDSAQFMGSPAIPPY